jgi:putative transposase
MNKVKTSAHSKYLLQYHCVWCPKYRRRVLTGPVADRLEQLVPEIVKGLEGEVIELVVREDHVHLFVSVPPKVSPAHCVHQIKGKTSRILREEFPSLRSRLPTLWTRSYFVGSAGAVASGTIRRYIEDQKGK